MSIKYVDMIELLRKIVKKNNLIKQKMVLMKIFLLLMTIKVVFKKVFLKRQEKIKLMTMQVI